MKLFHEAAYSAFPEGFIPTHDIISVSGSSVSFIPVSVSQTNINVWQAVKRYFP